MNIYNAYSFIEALTLVGQFSSISASSVLFVALSTQKKA